MAAPVKVQREELLRALESLTGGLSPREIVEQSKCFIIKDGIGSSYNDEVCCSCPVPLPKDFEGAVPAEKLLECLRKLPDDELSVSETSEGLLFRGKGRKLLAKKEVVGEEMWQCLKGATPPKEWMKISEDFTDAVKVVQACASQGPANSQYDVSYVNLTPDHLEASDTVQVCRWPLKTGLKESVLVKASAVKAVCSLGIDEWSIAESWIHFRDSRKGGVTVSCRRYVEDFPDLSAFLKCPGGKKVVLPKSLKDAAELASIYSAENGDENVLQVKLSPGRMRVRGTGVSGWVESTKKVDWDGGEVEFYVPPAIITSMVDRSGEELSCLVSSDRIKVKGRAGWSWCCCLMRSDEPSVNGQEPEDTEE